MSDWRKKQGPASFRGVKFFVDSGDSSGGRRTVVHEYPFSEKPPFTEDVGMRSRTFTVEGYVLGTEYTSARDALLTQLEKSGPGELVHPYFGTRRVMVASYRVRESRDSGGIARFSIEFAETVVAPSQPSVAVDAAVALNNSAAIATDSAGAQFLAGYNEVTALRDNIAGALRAASNAVGAVMDRVSFEAQANASLRRRLKNLTNNAVSLVNAPANILSSVSGLIDELAISLLTVSQANPAALLLKLYSFSPGDRPPATTPSRLIERANFDAFHRLFQRLVLIRAATVAVTQSFASYDDAVSVRASITDLLDQHVEEVTDEVYPALMQVRANLVQAVPGDAADLPKLQQYTPPATMPSLVLAHRLYGNLSLEQDLIDRNRVRHPGFVLGGTNLEILSRE